MLENMQLFVRSFSHHVMIQNFQNRAAITRFWLIAPSFIILKTIFINLRQKFYPVVVALVSSKISDNNKRQKYTKNGS